MNISFKNFLGELPKLDDERIPDGYSAMSVNARSGRQLLEPWFAPKLYYTAVTANPKSFAPFGNVTLEFGVPTSVVPAPLKNDKYQYTLICDGINDPQVTTIEKVTGNGTPITTHLNVPTPEAPTVTQGDVVAADLWYEGELGVKPDYELTEDEFDTSSVSYAICYVDAWGRRSALSPASDSVEIKEWNYHNTNKVTISLPSNPPKLLTQDANRGAGAIAKIEVYRTNYAGNGQGLFQYVGQTLAGIGAFNDQVFSGDLQESPLNSLWTGAPDTDTEVFPSGPIKQFEIMGADLLCGCNDKLVVFAEPGAFYAYPAEYYHVFRERIIRLVPFGTNMLVLTDGFPYVIQGSHPSSMIPTRLAEEVPCASPQGAIEVNGAVYFASRSGLYVVSGLSVAKVSEAFMTDREWASLDPASIYLATHDDLLIIYSKAMGLCYTLDPRSPQDGLRQIDISIDSHFNVAGTNELIYSPVGDANLYRFDGGNEYMPISYKSKVYTFRIPTHFSAARVTANSYPVTVRFCNDSSAPNFTKTVTSDAAFRLNFRTRAKRWWVSVSPEDSAGTTEIREIQIAQQIGELGDGA